MKRDLELVIISAIVFVISFAASYLIVSSLLPLILAVAFFVLWYLLFKKISPIVRSSITVGYPYNLIIALAISGVIAAVFTIIVPMVYPVVKDIIKVLVTILLSWLIFKWIMHALGFGDVVEAVEKIVGGGE